MRRIGLTGGIGSGKSTVAARLRELGAHVVDADAIAREVVAAGTPGLDQIVERFGAEMVLPEGTLDRPRLAQRVFSDPEALAALNAITHPLIAARTAELVAQIEPDGVMVHDVALLVENNLQGAYDAVVVVTAPEEVRVARLIGRGLTEQDARARIARQATEEQRRAVATVLIDNSGDLAALTAQVEAVWPRIAGDSAG